MSKQIKVILPRPQPKQELFLKDEHRYVAFGGARGGGKSWALQFKAIVLCVAHAGIRICIIRRTYAELVENHINPILKLLPRGVCKYNKSEKTLTFVNGSVILFRYCSNDSDLRFYQGVQFDVVMIDEATQLLENHFREISASCRGINNFPKRIYLTCNPGGVGHAWVKRLFIDREFREGEDPDAHSFIQSLVTDNKKLLEENPDYIKILQALSPRKREAWLHGKWDLIEGQYFNEFDRSLHVIDPFHIPSDWRRYRAIDYGLDMLSCLWIAVSPEREVIVYRELHEENLIISEAARKINALTDYERGERIYQTLAPPDLWNRSQETGKSKNRLFYESGLTLSKSSNDREAGWLAIKELLALRSDGTVRLKIFRNCTNLIKNLPLLQIDDKRPNDCANEPHEITHDPDALRYFAIAFTRPAPEEEEIGTARWTDDMYEDWRNANAAEREILINKWGKPPRKDRL